MRFESTFAGQFSKRLIRSFFAMFDTSRTECKISTKKCANDGPSEYSHWIGADQFPNECHTGIFQHTHYVLSHEIEILLAHFRHLVCWTDENGLTIEMHRHCHCLSYLIFHLSGIVTDYESVLLLLRFLIELAVLMNTVEFLE